MGRKGKKFEQYYGRPYVPKEFIKVKVCTKCGRVFQNLHRKNCPYCFGVLVEKYVRKKKSHAKP